MTLLLCFEAQDNSEITIDEQIVVSENASGMGGSQIFLETNGSYKIRELIKGIVIASANDGKVNLMATATKGALDQGAHAGNLIKAIAGLVGGGGGGRPNMAQAGGKNPAGIPDAIAEVAVALEGLLK